MNSGDPEKVSLCKERHYNMNIWTLQLKNIIKKKDCIVINIITEELGHLIGLSS